MITGKSFEEKVNEMCEYISVEYDEDENVWNIYSTDPEECDENIVIATLSVDDLELKIPDLQSTYDLAEFILGSGGLEHYCKDLDWDEFNKQHPDLEDDDDIGLVFAALTEEQLFDCLIEWLIDSFTDRVVYYESILDDLKNDFEKSEE